MGLDDQIFARQNSCCLLSYAQYVFTMNVIFIFFLIQMVIVFIHTLDYLYTCQIPQTHLMEHCVTRTTDLRLPGQLTSAYRVV